MEREREQLLEENRRRLSLVEAIFEATQDGIVVYGPEGEILHMNAAAEESLGLVPEELTMDIAQRWELLRVTKMDGSPMSLEEIPSHKALTGEKEQAILHFQPPRRQARWFSVSAAPIGLPEAHPASAVAIFTDITKFHDLQQEHELFMQMISHDLRTPVTVIQGHAEMLEQRLTKKDEITILNLEAIQASIRQLDSMMDDLMRFFQDKRGEIPLELERIDISQFFTKLVRRLDIPGIKERLQNEVPPGLPAVLADEESLERILSNLLSNALKYSPPDTPVIITAQQIDLEICISVTDRGKGIPRADQQFLFDKFFRARDTGKKTGIGLGLFITRKLVEAHGGRIWVKSEPGTGNVFTFSLPVLGLESK